MKFKQGDLVKIKTIKNVPDFASLFEGKYPILSKKEVFTVQTATYPKYTLRPYATIQSVSKDKYGFRHGLLIDTRDIKHVK